MPPIVECTLVNGDAITGEVIAMHGGKLEFESKLLGDITIELEQIRAIEIDRGQRTMIEPNDIAGVDKGAGTVRNGPDKRFSIGNRACAPGFNPGLVVGRDWWVYFFSFSPI